MSLYPATEAEWQRLMSTRPGEDEPPDDDAGLIDPTIRACYICKTMFVEPNTGSRLKYCGPACRAKAKRIKDAKRKRRKRHQDKTGHRPRRGKVTRTFQNRDAETVGQLQDQGCDVGISRSLAAYAYEISGQPPGGPGDGRTANRVSMARLDSPEATAWLSEHPEWWKTEPLPRTTPRARWAYMTVHDRDLLVKDRSETTKEIVRLAAMAIGQSLTVESLSACCPRAQTLALVTAS